MASLGLVAYGSSDEEGSDVEDAQDSNQNGDVQTTGKVEISKKDKPNLQSEIQNTVKSTADDIHISDEEDDYPRSGIDTESSSLNASKFLNLPPPSSVKSKEDPLLSVQQNRTLNSVQAPLSGPQLEDDIITSSSTLLPGLPVPKADDSGPAQPKSTYAYDDELEEEVKPKDYEKNAPKPPAPKAKKRQPVKITVPSLFDYSDDEDEPQAKRPATSQGKGKLFSLLPEPKNVVTKQVNRKLIPHTLGKKPTPAPKPTAKKIPPVGPGGIKMKPGIKKPVSVSAFKPDLLGHESDEEDDSGPINFFGFGKDDAKPADQIASKKFSFRKDESIGPALPLSGVGANEPEIAEVMPGPAMIPMDLMEEDEAEPYGGEVQQYLHDDEFLKIQGKKHRGKEEINLIDVNVADQTDPSELMKNLTEEQQMSSHSRKRKDMPTSQQRRKHQITYLAFQAKERELDLKNQWSQNRQTRKQTQSKYGF